MQHNVSYIISSHTYAFTIKIKENVRVIDSICGLLLKQAAIKQGLFIKIKI